MKNVNKIYNFFTTRYYDNIKYNHSTAALLRIFFERANKTKQSVSNLGNVYRNSKWSDLKVQNIKFTHVNSFISQLLLALATLVFTFVLVFRLDFPTFTLLFTNLLSLLWYLVDSVNYIFTLLLLIVYRLHAYLLGSGYDFNGNLKSHKASKGTAIGSSVNLQTPNKLSVDQLNLLTNLFSSHNSISRLPVESSFPEHKASCANLLNLSTSPTDFTYSIASLENKHTLSVDKYMSNSVAYKSSLTLSDLNSTQSSAELNQLINDSMSSSFRTAEYSRWLLKSSPISENLANSLFNFTQSKSLVGSSNTNSNLSTNNVWASSAYESNNIGSLLPLDNFKSVLNSNINFFESSSIFNSKRLYFTTQPRYASTVLASTQLNTNVTKSHGNSYQLISNAVQLDIYNSVKHLLLDVNTSRLTTSAAPSDAFSLMYTSKNNLAITDSLNLFVIDINTSRDTGSSNFRYYTTHSYVIRPNASKLNLVL